MKKAILLVVLSFFIRFAYAQTASDGAPMQQLKKRLEIRKLQVMKQKQIINIMQAQSALRQKQISLLQLDNKRLKQQNAQLRIQLRAQQKKQRRRRGLQMIGGSSGLVVLLVALTVLK